MKLRLSGCVGLIGLLGLIATEPAMAGGRCLAAFLNIPRMITLSGTVAWLGIMSYGIRGLGHAVSLLSLMFVAECLLRPTVHIVQSTLNGSSRNSP